MSSRLPSATVDPRKSAKKAGLHYVTDAASGFTRRKRGSGFEYCDIRGRKLHDHNTLVRIKRLAIPPAWTEVWICPDADGHLQATGRDARGRKQYRYHHDWRAFRDETKYGRMIAFGHALPKIRQTIERDLRRKGLAREKVLAVVLRLLETTLVRVGNDAYARDNESYGLTTLRDRHAKLGPGRLSFEFRGKSGKKHKLNVRDPKLRKLVKRCRDLPGYELFQYIDEQGEVRDVTSTDVNARLREITGEEFTAKDFRTWAGTVLAAHALRNLEAFGTMKEAKKNLTTAIEAVARMLGNTAAICRKCYVHPVVMDTYLEGELVRRLRRRARRELERNLPELRAEERAVLRLLEETL